MVNNQKVKIRGGCKCCNNFKIVLSYPDSSYNDWEIPIVHANDFGYCIKVGAFGSRLSVEELELIIKKLKELNNG